MRKGRSDKGQFHNRPNIALRLAAVMLVMVCVSTWMLAGLLAKYTTQDSGNDNARVIQFGDLNMTEIGDFATGSTAMIIPGVNLQKKVLVSFSGSESATYVFVEAILSGGWIPTSEDCKSFVISDDMGNNQLTWGVADGWTLAEANEVNGTYVFYRKLAPNDDSLYEPGVDFIANDGIITVSDQITKSEIAGMTGISIKLRAVVVQSNGFAEPGAAWASVASK